MTKLFRGGLLALLCACGAVEAAPPRQLPVVTANRPVIGGPPVLLARFAAEPAPAPSLNRGPLTLVPPAPGESFSPDAGAPAPLESLSQPIALYPHVDVDDLDNIAPCAVPMIIAVPDPCATINKCCPTPTVYVKICVPPDVCPQVTVDRGGYRVNFDYGKYGVQVQSKKGVVYVDYDD